MNVRMTVAVALTALVSACSGAPDQAAAPPDVSDLTQPDPDDTEPGDDEPADEGPQGSSLEVTGSHVRSEVDIRVAEILSDLDASQAPAGAVVEIEDTVLFDFDSADLRPEAAAVLDELVELLDLLDDAPAEVRGHTDDVGGDDYNLQLSLARADTVADFFVEAGIDRARLQTEGLGSSEPVADNQHADGSDDPEGRARNRRVEIVLPTIDMDQLPGG